MGIVDIYLLKVLSELPEKNLSLKEIVYEITKLNLKKPPSRIALYQRLSILSERRQVNFIWEEGAKFYIISPKGLMTISEHKKLLISA